MKTMFGLLVIWLLIISGCTQAQVPDINKTQNGVPSVALAKYDEFSEQYIEA